MHREEVFFFQKKDHFRKRMNIFVCAVVVFVLLFVSAVSFTDVEIICNRWVV